MSSAVKRSADEMTSVAEVAILKSGRVVMIEKAVKVRSLAATLLTISAARCLAPTLLPTQ
jgi:hypothetical protein